MLEQPNPLGPIDAKQRQRERNLPIRRAIAEPAPPPNGTTPG
jgi:hypothetical protein